MQYDFEECLEKSKRISESIAVKNLYEKKVGSRIKRRTIVSNKKSQKAGYDVILEFENGYILTTEEKVRFSFYPDILLEMRHTGDINRLGWLYLSNAEVLSYIQVKDNRNMQMTLWKLKDLANWVITNEFVDYVNQGYIRKITSSSKNNGNSWCTKSLAVPFEILRKKNLNFKINRDQQMPIEFFDNRSGW